MRSLGWICLFVLVLSFTLPAVSQTSLTPSAALGPPDSNTLAGTSSNAAERSTFEADPEQLGKDLMNQHRYQAALDAYRRVLVPSAKLWSSMGIAYELLSDYRDAVRCDKEAISLDPRNARMINNLATVYDQLGDYRRAERLYREAIQLAPNAAVYLKNLGTNLLAQHQFQKGSAVYQQALALDPNILEFSNAPPMALPHRDNAEANYAKARTCAQAGLIDCTLVYLRKALDEGAVTPAKVASDSEFAKLRDSSALQQLFAEQRESVISNGGPGSRRN